MKQSAWVVGGSMTVFAVAALFALHTNTADSQVSGNRAPVARAKVSINGGAYSDKFTVTQGVPVTIRITAGDKGSAGSFDPDGWGAPGKGVAKGGKIEWNNNLSFDPDTFGKTFTNPASPSHADMNLGQKIFTLPPNTYTYNMLRITDAGGLVSQVGTVTFTVVANPDPNANKAPFAVAKMSINGGTYSSEATVIQGVPVDVSISAGEHGSKGSFDPNGWNTVGKGVAKGGKIEWNSNLWLGEPRFEKTFTNPVAPTSADMKLGKKTFTLAPGKYTYNLLKITDAGGLVSNVGSVTLTVVTGSTQLPSPAPCNPYDGGCDVPNGYDGGSGGGSNGYDSVAPSGTFTATISSPAPGTTVAQGKDVPVAVFGNGVPACGYWTLRTPSGQTVTLSAAHFAAGQMPGNMKLCAQP